MISEFRGVVVDTLLSGASLADRWREARSQRARMAEIAATLDRFQWLVLEDLAEARRAFQHRDRQRGNAEVTAFLAAHERARMVGIPDERAVYRLADRMAQARDRQA
ncbi:hypothetical protein [Rhodococcus sp. WAY2]|uniref:hypothetical protein n=1 Tax=Rhodococcus sp. WAY2 TaxID=2663121 RepID=UPI00131F4933|nr:hypothetical protein [Rhodococcus sp. WAY2]QHE73510.1 hypothetical protein GFS60_07170 [Rhodococcus sp. WAY2]